MSSVGLLGVIEERPFEWSPLHPEVARAIISGLKRTPGLGRTPALGTNTLSPCRAECGPNPGPEGGPSDHEGRSNLIGIGVLTLIFPGLEEGK